VRLGNCWNAGGKPPPSRCVGIYGFAYRSKKPEHPDPSRQIVTQCPSGRAAWNGQSGLTTIQWAVTNHFWRGSVGSGPTLWMRSNLLMGDGSVQAATPANTQAENPWSSTGFGKDFTWYDGGGCQWWGAMRIQPAEYGRYQNGKRDGNCNPDYIGCGLD
jgi:hypothetical protein